MERLSLQKPHKPPRELRVEQNERVSTELEPRSPHEQFLIDRVQRFGDDCCFLCGAHIPVGNSQRTIEHVFPKWLLHELNMWDSSVNQINGRALHYRRLTVPCCLTCNGVDLSGIESRVRSAYRDGIDAFANLDRLDLFLWLGKIYYGLVYKESLQPLSVSDQAGARLVPVAHLESIQFHHFLLQAAAGVVQWEHKSPGPASFHFFECLDSDEPEFRFDYLDDLMLPIIGIRIGKIGVVAILQDWGRSEGVRQPQIDTAKSFPLHPTQFREVYARLAYMSETSWSNQDHLISGGNGFATIMTPDPGDFAGTWDWKNFAARLAGAWEVPEGAIFDGTNGMSTIGGGGAPPNPAESMHVIFVAMFSKIGLWPYANVAPSDWTNDGTVS
ncbi:MAG: hypothetical protein JWQ12_1803 [Glaciihabitans sp.]|nr:hypothetical protein [Glaciihabitans sp.]